MHAAYESTEEQRAALAQTVEQLTARAEEVRWCGVSERCMLISRVSFSTCTQLAAEKQQLEDALSERERTIQQLTAAAAVHAEVRGVASGCEFMADAQLLSPRHSRRCGHNTKRRRRRSTAPALRSRTCRRRALRTSQGALLRVFFFHENCVRVRSCSVQQLISLTFFALVRFVCRFEEERLALERSAVEQQRKHAAAVAELEDKFGALETERSTLTLRVRALFFPRVSLHFLCVHALLST